MHEQNQQSKSFDEWAILELFGHQRLAGRVTEQTIGGAAMVRVDVPEVENRPAFTKFYGAAAIYSITPVSEDIARRTAGYLRQEPIRRYELGALPAAPVAAEDGEDTRYLDTDEED